MKVDDKICIAFNTLRADKQGEQFSRKEIHELLMNNIPGFSKQDYIISILASKKVIIRVGTGRNTKYVFPSNPVHIATLSSAIFGMKEYNSEHFKKSYEKRKETPKQPEQSTSKLVHVDEEYCIRFLKERGYKILKQTVNYEEV